LATIRGRPPSRAEGAQEAVNKIRALQKALGLNDQALADRVRIAQTSVGRALNRKPPVWSPSLKRIWAYAENMGENSTADARKSAAARTLSDAALKAWDGTEEGLSRLVRILNLLGQYPPSKCR